MADDINRSYTVKKRRTSRGTLLRMAVPLLAITKLVGWVLPQRGKPTIFVYGGFRPSAEGLHPPYD